MRLSSRGATPLTPVAGATSRVMLAVRLAHQPGTLAAMLQPAEAADQKLLLDVYVNDYAIGAVITRLIGNREVVIASAGNRVKTSGSSIKHVELETLKYVSSGYGRYLPDFVLYSTHEPCAMCAGACVWSKIGAVVFGVSQQDITAYGKKHGTEEFKWRACLISCKFVLEKGGLHIPVFDSFLRLECRKLFRYRA